MAQPTTDLLSTLGPRVTSVDPGREDALSPGRQIGVAAAPRVRILYFDNDAGTFLLHRLSLARAAASAGFEVHVCVPESRRARELVEEGFSVHAISMSRRRLSPVSDVKTFLSIRRVIRNVRPDLIHNLRIKPVLYGGIAARLGGHGAVVNMLTGLGTAFTTKGFPGVALRAIVGLGLRVAFGHRNQCATVESSGDYSRLRASGILGRNRCVVVSGSGVDTNVYRPIGGRSAPPLVVFASRLLWNKGVAEFVRAAAILKERGSSARFVLVGAPDPENPASVPDTQLREWADSGIVDWWNWRSDMPAILAQSSVVCLPTTYGEGIPRILIEAAACGVPIVATDIPGCREIVGHEESGLLTPPNNAEAVANAISRILYDEALRTRLGDNGRRRVLDKFEIERVLAQVFDVYAELIPDLHARLAGSIPTRINDFSGEARSGGMKQCN
jgi:glycosyltransferase involved in cell wall biosynthesis